jgi:hypothetical protein
LRLVRPHRRGWPVPARRAVLRQWVDSVPGGWSDAVSIHLPVSMPRGLAQANIRTHARCLGLTVQDDPDAPEMMAWLR